MECVFRGQGQFGMKAHIGRTPRSCRHCLRCQICGWRAKRCWCWIDKSVCNGPQWPEKAQVMAQDEAMQNRGARFRVTRVPNRRISITSLLDEHLPFTCADLRYQLSCVKNVGSSSMKSRRLQRPIRLQAAAWSKSSSRLPVRALPQCHRDGRVGLSGVCRPSRHLAFHYCLWITRPRNGVNPVPRFLRLARMLIKAIYHH